VGRRGFEPLTSCVSSKAKRSTGVQHEPGKPCLTWDDIPSASQDHQPHPGRSGVRFLSIFLSTRRQGHRPWSRWRYLLESVISIARSASSRRAWPPRSRNHFTTRSCGWRPCRDAALRQGPLLPAWRDQSRSRRARSMRSSPRSRRPSNTVRRTTSFPRTVNIDRYGPTSTSR
jgi:hypothetical protein